MRSKRVCAHSRFEPVARGGVERREVDVKLPGCFGFARRAGSALTRSGLLGALLLVGAPAWAGPPPPPDWQPAPPVVVVAPVPAVVYATPVPFPPPAPPQPLPTALRIVYAPFYVAGLTIRYGFYYGIVVPLEVFGRALAYGFEGGVADPDGKPEGK